MTQRLLQFEETVASRIEALLARCDRVKRARDLDRPAAANSTPTASPPATAKPKGDHRDS